MKRVIEGKLYDTETAELVHEWSNSYFPTDFKWRQKDLYRTPKSNWFIHHNGGAMTDMAVQAGNNSYGGSEDIEPITEEEAIHFLETHGGDKKLLELFPEKVEEA